MPDTQSQFDTAKAKLEEVSALHYAAVQEAEKLKAAWDEADAKAKRLGKQLAEVDATYREIEQKLEAEKE